VNVTLELLMNPSQAVDVFVSFSLTPARSRWERGTCQSALAASERARLLGELTAVLPLPAGEGRGEGERAEASAAPGYFPRELTPNPMPL